MTLDKIGFSRSVLKSNPDSGAGSWVTFPIPWLDNRTVSIERPRRLVGEREHPLRVPAPQSARC